MGELAREYYAMTQAASDRLVLEHTAVMKVQSFYRAARVRNTMYAVIGASRRIQRVIRGFLARTRAMRMQADRIRRLNMHFFHHCATIIQKFFRGWRSRKHLHNFHGRKQYLATIEQRGEHTKEWLQNMHRRKLEEAKRQEEDSMKNEFDNLAGELHHLVSTKSVAGVYNPPYNDVLPTAFGKPIEQHLRDSCKAQVPTSLRRPRHREAIANANAAAATGMPMGPQLGRSHRQQQEYTSGQEFGPPQELPNRSQHHSRTASVGRMQKIQGPFKSREQQEVANAKAVSMYRSIQASTPYELMDEDRKMQERIAKLTRVSPIDFAAPGLPMPNPMPSSVHTGVPHRERPFELRGDYTELPKIRDKPPFFTAVPGNKHFAEYHEQSLLPSGHV